MIEDKNYDLCCSMLKELLRYEEAEEILVHINRLIVGNSRKINVIEYKKLSGIKQNPEENINKVLKLPLHGETLA